MTKISALGCKPFANKELLPDGLASKNQHLYSIVAEGNDTPFQDQGWGHFKGGEAAQEISYEFYWPLL